LAAVSAVFIARNAQPQVTSSNWRCPRRSPDASPPAALPGTHLHGRSRPVPPLLQSLPACDPPDRADGHQGIRASGDASTCLLGPSRNCALGICIAEHTIVEFSEADTAQECFHIRQWRVPEKGGPTIVWITLDK